MKTISLKDLKAQSKPQLKRPGTAKPRPQEVRVEVQQAEAPPTVVNVDMSEFAASQKDIFAALTKVLHTPQPVAEPVKEWEFTVKRDSNNLIETITAKAK